MPYVVLEDDEIGRPSTISLSITRCGRGNASLAVIPPCAERPYTDGNGYMCRPLDTRYDQSDACSGAYNDCSVCMASSSYRNCAWRLPHLP